MKLSQPPRTRLQRALARAPIWFYRLGLGGLLGHRFVLLTHTGRNSGRPRQVVLEVVGRREAANISSPPATGAAPSGFATFSTTPRCTSRWAGVITTDGRARCPPRSPDTSSASTPVATPAPPLP
jgi:hypothetical protein